MGYPAVETIGTETLVQFDGKLARLERFERATDGLVAVVGQNERQVVIPLGEFWPRVSPIRARSPLDALEEPDHASWLGLPVAVREAAVDLARDLLEITTGSRRGAPEIDRAAGQLNPAYDPLFTTEEERIARKVAERRSRGVIPASRSQLRKRMVAFRLGGVYALVHRSRKCASAGIPSQLSEPLGEFLASRLHEARVSLPVLANMARSELARNGHAVEMSATAWERTVGEAARGLGLHREVRSRSTRNNVPAVPFGKLSASRPGEIVHIDATPTNIHCFFPEIGWARATVLTAIDVYDRDIVALRVVGGATNSRDVAMLLWDIGRPTITKAGFPFNLMQWHGMPRWANITVSGGRLELHPTTSIGRKGAVHPSTVVLDNGAENRSLHLLSVAAANSIGIIFCPPAAPHTKGVVEAWHNGLDGFQQALPGYKGAAPANHPKLAELGALLTVGDLYDALWTWVLTVYRLKPHDGLFDPANPKLKPSPAEIFERYLCHGGEITIPTDPWRLTGFLSSTRRHLQDYGINLRNRVYNSGDLQELRSTAQRGPGRKPIPFTIHYDRYDVSRIYLRHPIVGNWMMIPRADPDGLSLPPCSEILSHAAMVQSIRGERGSLTVQEQRLAEAKLYADWSRGIFEDRRAQRMAALEANRAAAYAHDLEDSTDEYRNLAFPELAGTEPEAAQEIDDDTEVLRCEDDVVDGFAL